MTDLAPMDRRTLLERMAFLLGVAVLPAEALAQTDTPSPLSPPQSRLLSALVDTILPTTDTPGALEAGVPARLEGLMANWASAQTRAGMLAALERLDAAAMAQTGQGLAALAPAARADFLRAHDAAALVSVPPPPGEVAAHFFAQTSHVVDPGYLKLKELTINLYYHSAIAARTELIYEHVPGPWQPSITLTPQSRPYLGAGPF